jgi:tetraacyldisaccharide 4'-kinase
LLDVLYAQAAGARRRWFERHPEARRSLRHPVISVGNLSVGGTGKTPLVSRIAEWLISAGERPAILSRGYKRRNRVDGVVVVSDGTGVRAGVDESGDEPMMLARQLPSAVVCVSEDRYLAGALAERELGATIHVLDDGFQHVQLARDYDVLLTTAGEITHGRVLPFGRLRESRSAAARADFLVVVDADLDTARSEAWELGISQFASARRVPRATCATDAADQAVFAVAGIGAPERFFAMLRESGFNVAGTSAFPDHHQYSAKDVAKIASEARAAGAADVVTTEKDAVRFEAIAALPFALRAVPMTLVVDHWDALTAGIEQALARARGIA